MKKVLGIVMVLVMVFGMTSTAYAKGNTKQVVLKPVEVSITQFDDEIEAGTAVDLVAVVEKKGQLVSGQWAGADHTSTVYDDVTGNYISNASFVADAAGDYTITYTIRMKTGNSHIRFEGVGTSVISYYENDELVVVQSITIRVKSVTPNYSGGKDPQLVNYTVLADVTTTLSNGEIDTEEITIIINKHARPEDVLYTYVNEDYEIEEEVTFESVPNIVGYTDTIELN